MPEDKPVKNIEDYLRERDRIDETIQREFLRELTVMFSDICDYTAMTERYGTLKSRAIVQKHNDMLFEVIRKNGGKPVKTIGDAVIAVYETPEEGVQAAIDMHRRLQDYNRTGVEWPIRVKIGLNLGPVLMEENDVNGDPVNVAARIQGKAGKDEILISRNIYDRIRSGDVTGFPCRYHGSFELKGKTLPRELYRVFWKPGEETGEKEPVLRSVDVESPEEASADLLYIEVRREKEQIRISAHEPSPGQTHTVRQYVEFPLSGKALDRMCAEIADLLNQANRKGRSSPDVTGPIIALKRILLQQNLYGLKSLPHPGHHLDGIKP